MTRRKKHDQPPVRPQQPKAPDPQPPRDWQWWILAAAIPLMLCASKLDLDLWYDEAYTLDVFVSQPWIGIATDYSAPNNHVFYSLLLRPVYLLSDSEFVLRFPSLVFTIGTLVMVFRLARRWAGLPAAVLATLFLGLTQMFLIHTMQVRGYGLSMFLATWLADMAAAERPGRWWRRVPTIAVVGGALLYVLPSNLLFLIPLAAVALVWTAVRDRSFPSALREASAWGLAFLLAGLLYLPIIDQVHQVGAGRTSASVLDVLSLAGRVFFAAGRDWLPVLPLAVLGLAFWAQKPLRRPSPGHVVLPLLTLAMLAGPFLLTNLLGVLPFVRNYCLVLPFLALAIGWLLAELIAAAGGLLRFARSDSRVAVVGVLLLAAVALPRIWTYPSRLAEYRRHEFAQDGYYNYYAAAFHPSEVVSYLRRTIGPGESYRICFADADHFPLWHYFRRAAMPLERSEDGLMARPPTLYLIVPELPDYEALSAKCGLPAETLRRFPLVRDFGYYRLYRSSWTPPAGTPRRTRRSPGFLPVDHYPAGVQQALH